jgi:FkbM family methyltransferase
MTQIRRKQASQGELRCRLLGGLSGWILVVVMLLTTQSSDVQLRILPPNENVSVTTDDTTKESSLEAKQRAPIVIPGTDLSCSDAKQKAVNKEWLDPNEGKVWARETITYPHFYISLHAEAYDPVRWRIMEEGKYYEDEVHKNFVSILDDKSPASYVLDVGANIGYYTLLSASLGHNVIAFEPNPANVLRLCDSLRLNDFLDNNNNTPEIHIFQNAVADVHGEEMMLHSPRNPGQAFLRAIEKGQDEETKDTHKAKTTVVMLDKVAEEQGWFTLPDFKIKLMKVDVEGKEPQVFLGAPKLLKSGIVEHILMEGRRFGRPNIQESFAVLFDAGYTIKDPVIPITAGYLPKEKAKAVCDWWLATLVGTRTGAVRDMWWVKAE